MIFILSGPSGSGKTTLLARLLKDKRLRNKLKRPVSFTTRAKRSGEKDKRDYFFIDKKDFKRKLKAKKILEWTKYLGYYYGTPRDFVDSRIKKGKHLGLCLDYRGLQQIKRFYPQQAKGIFILPPDLETLRKRISGRCSKTTRVEIRRRLDMAAKELSLAQKYDYCLVNNKLAQTLRKLKAIVLKEISAK